MKQKKAEAVQPKTDEAPARGRRWIPVVIVVSVVAVVVTILVVRGPDSATYDEYLQLREGMTRQQVVGIIGMGDFWHHAEGDKDVTSWVNGDGTYIRAVFDKKDVLVEVSWESGWNPAWQKE